MPTTPFHFPPNKECYGLDRKFKYNRGIKSEFDKKMTQFATANYSEYYIWSLSRSRKSGGHKQAGR